MRYYDLQGDTVKGESIRKRNPHIKSTGPLTAAQRRRGRCATPRPALTRVRAPQNERSSSAALQNTTPPLCSYILLKKEFPFKRKPLVSLTLLLLLTPKSFLTNHAVSTVISNHFQIAGKYNHVSEIRGCWVRSSALQLVSSIFERQGVCKYKIFMGFLSSSRQHCHCLHFLHFF